MKKASLIVLVLIIGSLKLFAQSKSSFEIIPTNEGFPISLKIAHSTANVFVEGYEGDKLFVEIFRNNKPIKLNSLPIKFIEDNNNIILRLLDRNNGYEFKIKVPVKTSLDISIERSKIIEVRNTEGDVKISTLTSDIKLTNIIGDIDIRSFSGNVEIENLDGSPIVYCTKGKVTLSFMKLPEQFSNIIDTVSGKITLFLNGNDDVLLRIRFDVPDHHFNLKSDFDLVPADENSFPLGGDDVSSIYRKINKGKSPIYLKTFKGIIELKKKPKRNN